MTTSLRRFAVMLVLFVLAIGPVFSQGTSSDNGFKLTLGTFGVGVQTFDDVDPDTGTKPTTYQTLAWTPEIAIGKFGIGLAIVWDYRLVGSTIETRMKDWVPEDGWTFESALALYLPKIMYVRWGEMGDPLFVKLGSFTDGTLGDGFIMGDYDNTLFLPKRRHFGLEAGIDGSLFQFPYVGIQAVAGNLAVLDVTGGRVYVRPLVSTNIPILNNLQVGVTGVVDTQPTLIDDTTMGVASPIGVFGLDAQLPLVYVKDVVSLVSFADEATIGGKSWGTMVGLGGKLINIFTYGAQIRLLNDTFTADYFGPTYDVLRNQQYAGAQATPTTLNPGWLASLGTSFLDDKFVFKVSLDGLFTTPTDIMSYPHLRGILSLAEGVVPGVTFDFSYDKKGITTWADLVDATNAVIRAEINFKSGPAVISFVYGVVYDPTSTSGSPWVVTSGIESSIALF